MPMKSDNNFQSKSLNYFNGLYKRNKIVLIIAAAIFFVFIFIGILTGYSSSDFTGNLLNEYVKAVGRMHIDKTTLSFFIHNLRAALVTFAGGIIGIIPVLTISSNGFLYGAFLGYLIHGSIVSSFGAFTPLDFIIYTIPHGIFEIPGFIISGAAGFRLTTLIMGVLLSIIRKTPLSEHYWKLKDSIALLAVAIVLIFIAAIIEANITLSLGNYITGLNLPHH